MVKNSKFNGLFGVKNSKGGLSCYGSVVDGQAFKPANFLDPAGARGVVQRCEIYAGLRTAIFAQDYARTQEMVALQVFSTIFSKVYASG